MKQPCHIKNYKIIYAFNIVLHILLDTYKEMAGQYIDYYVQIQQPSEEATLHILIFLPKQQLSL